MSPYLVAQCSCVLSQARSCISKFQILGIRCDWTCDDPLGVGFAAPWLMPICLRKVVALLDKGSEFMVPSAVAFVAMLINRVAQQCPPSLLSPERQCHLSQMHPKKENSLSPAIQRILKLLVCSQASALLPHRSTTKPDRHDPLNGMNLQNFQL